MNQAMVASIRQGLAAKSDDELLSMWQADDSDREGEASEALRLVAAERGLALPKRVRFPKATAGDIALSVLLPYIGIAIGVTALVRGQIRRGLTMIAIGGGVVALIVAVAGRP